MSTTAEKTSFKEQLLAHFNDQLPSLYGDAELRRKAAGHFASAGFPSRRTEDYKYIAPDSLFKKGFGFRSEQARDLNAADIKKMTIVNDSFVAVILNGVFVPELSSLENLPAGMTVSALADAVVSNEAAKKSYAEIAAVESDAFTALNTAMNAGGIFLHIAKNAVIEKPLQILHIADNETEAFFQPRNLVIAEENSQAVFIETFESVGPVKSFSNALTEVVVAANAKLDHYRLQWESESGQLLSTVQSKLAANALYNTYTFSLGGAWVRNNLNILLSGQNGEAHLFGLYLPNGNQVVDNHTVVDHSVPNCMSNELYKGVINGKATAVFNGKIFVRPDAQKTNAFQTNRNILLSDDASVNTKPQLEIYADDVKCSHGTSTGRIDEDALFYLRARGVGEENARKLLIRAFAEEVVNQVKIEEIKAVIEERIDELLK